MLAATVLTLEFSKQGCHTLRNVLAESATDPTLRYYSVYVIKSRMFIEHGAEGIRTPDLFNANEALYQLSHSPTDACTIAGPECVCQGYDRP